MDFDARLWETELLRDKQQDPLQMKIRGRMFKNESEFPDVEAQALEPSVGPV